MSIRLRCTDCKVKTLQLIIVISFPRWSGPGNFLWSELYLYLISHLIFWVLKRLAPFGAKILLLLINPCHLAPKYLEHFIGSTPPLFILDPLLWIGSAYVSLYINSCFGLNKLLTNLTSSRQHHLQYTYIVQPFRSKKIYLKNKIEKCYIISLGPEPELWTVLIEPKL